MSRWRASSYHLLISLAIGAVALARLATAFERHPAATAARSVEAA